MNYCVVGTNKYARIPVIGVIGADKCSNEDSINAFKVGKIIGSLGYYCICGGLGGIMESAAKGAKDSGGLTIGILPGFESEDRNEYIDIPIVTGLSHARNIIIARSADILIALPGSNGTLSEIAIALKLKKSVLALNSWGHIDGVIYIKNINELEGKLINLLKDVHNLQFKRS